MSEIVNAQPKPKSTRAGAADRAAIAEVERWMAMIREISREQIKN